MCGRGRIISLLEAAHFPSEVMHLHTFPTAAKQISKPVYITNDLNVTCFCVRNLRRHVRVPVKKERNRNRKKRIRDDSQGPRIAKQLRVHLQHISNDVFSSTDNNGLHPTSGHSSSPGFEASSDQEINNPADANVETVELISSTVKPSAAPPKQKAQKKTGGFRDLLAQLRGNSSMIVRETR